MSSKYEMSDSKHNKGVISFPNSFTCFHEVQNITQIAFLCLNIKDFTQTEWKHTGVVRIIRQIPKSRDTLKGTGEENGREKTTKGWQKCLAEKARN